MIQEDSSETTVNLASNLIKYQVLSACHKLKINPEDCLLTVENFSEIIKMIKEGVINIAISDAVIFEAVKNATTLNVRKVKIFHRHN